MFIFRNKCNRLRYVVNNKNKMNLFSALGKLSDLFIWDIVVGCILKGYMKY